MMTRLLSLAVLLCLAACAHNLPEVDTPNEVIGPGAVRTYVDMNGTFYPPGWRSPDVVGEAQVRRSHSLLAATARRPQQRAAILAAEQTWLSNLTTLAADKTRVFIFLVGFNTSQTKSTPDLEAMRDAIEVGPDDLAIQFMWDGHDARIVVDAARIWFWGTGSSQVAGQHGLRRVINAVGDKEIVIVSYSRGASVVLSALSDPAYAPAFKAETESFDFLNPAGPDFFTPPALAPGRPIRVLMLAPAIGNPDFWSPGSDGNDWSFRRFPQRLESVRYTINPKDYVLNKLWLGLADNFNATDLGAYEGGGRPAACHYRFLQGYPVVGRVGHAVPDYLANPAFTLMLTDSGLEPRGSATLHEPAPIQANC